MGYTHFFSNSTISQTSWNRIIADVKKAFTMLPAEHNGMTLALEGNEGDNDPPVLTADMIRFNGYDPINGKDLGHETFMLERKGSSDFYKTNQKPYDLAVMVVLLIAAMHEPKKVTLGSTAHNGKEWKPAADIVKKVLSVKHIEKLPLLATNNLGAVSVLAAELLKEG